jgi:GTP-binding protein
LNFAPILSISALTGKRVKRIFPTIREIYQQYTKRVGTGELNRVLESALAANEPPLYKKKRLRFYYITQVSTRPPTFVVFVSFPKAVHFSYKRYLNQQNSGRNRLGQVPDPHSLPAAHRED